jgi:inosose dehydratase
MSSMRIATAPGTWGVEPGPPPPEPSWELVLDEIAAAGFDGTELGPLGFLPADPAQLAVELRSRGLALAGAFVMEPLHDPAATSRILTQAAYTTTLLRALDAKALILIASLTPERSATAGRPDVTNRLAGSDRVLLIRTVGGLVERAHERGIMPVLHPHAGTLVEYEDEIDDVLESAGPGLGLCIDTGHCLYSGIDPVALLRRHPDRVRHVHFKDVHADVLERQLALGATFEQSVAAGTFCPLGDGDVDLVSFVRELAAIGYDGWGTFEQDRLAVDHREAKSDAQRSLEHLRSLGASTQRPVRSRESFPR